MPNNPVTPRKGRLRKAIIISIVVHVVLLIGLLTWYSQRQNEKPQTTTADTTAVEAGATPTSPPPEDEPNSEAATTEPEPDVDADLVEMRIEKVQQQYDGLSDDEKVDALEKQLTKLDAIASEESVDKVTDALKATLGTNDRATQPAEAPVEGEFDFNTAQVHDVVRTQDEAGKWHYHSVLLDSAGRTTKVELGPEEGKTAYDTMQTIKNFPFADKIYRQLAMPIIDKMLAAQRAADEAMREAEQEGADETPDPSVTTDDPGTEESQENASKANAGNNKSLPDFQ